MRKSPLTPMALPAAVSSASITADSSPTAVATGSTRWRITEGQGTFLIDAPLEKIKGSSHAVTGDLVINPSDLSATTGAIRVSLAALTMGTFDNPEKNKFQTEHAQNWMEIGKESPTEHREDYAQAVFTITKVEALPGKVSEALEVDGARRIRATVTGTFRLHGIVAPKTIKITVTFVGPAVAPTSVTLKTDEPLTVSLKEHSVMPRDTVGKFLSGALDKIGKKIDDKVQVSFEAKAGR